MLDDLADFIKREVQLPPYPGACCRMVDNWIKRRIGLSALNRFGREYETDDDVKLWLAEPGGLAVAVNRVMRANGFPKVDPTQAGDIGLVLRNDMLCMALHTGTAWLMRDEHGVSTVPLNAVWKAWRIE